jgi:hypothetical protein
VKLKDNVHLAPRLIMSAAIPAYGFMGCTGTILGLSFNRIRVSDGSVKDKDITSRDFVPF